jgi:hypothetical protein
VTDRQGVGRSASSGGECDVSLAFNSEEKTPTDEVSAHAVGLYPVPCVTKLIGEHASTVVRIVLDELSDEIDLMSIYADTVDDLLPSHGQEDTADQAGRQGPEEVLPVNYYEISKYAEYHFVSEENMMMILGYPERDAHHELHVHLLNEMQVFASR